MGATVLACSSKHRPGDVLCHDTRHHPRKSRIRAVELLIALLAWNTASDDLLIIRLCTCLKAFWEAFIAVYFQCVDHACFCL